MKNIRLLLLSTSCMAALAACDQPRQPPAQQLQGHEWTVTSIDDKPVLENTKVTLSFTREGRLAGRSGCNQYTGSYSLDTGLSVGALAQTKMACAPALMQQENRFTQVLSNISRYAFTDAGVLVLSTQGGAKITARRQ